MGAQDGPKLNRILSDVVIVADADPNVRELVSHFLIDSGYNVKIETDGYEALDNIRKEPPLAVLADILLPRLDGLTLCRLLKDDLATQDVVAVIVFSVMDSEERAKKVGADAFLRKPLERTRVLKALKEATDKVNRSHD